MRIFGDVLGIVCVSGGGNPLEVYNSKEMTRETCRGMLNWFGLYLETFEDN